MSTVRRSLWYLDGFLKKHGKILLLSVFIGGVLVVILPNILSILPAVKQTRYIGRVGKFTLSGIPRDIQEKISYGLMRTSPTGEAIPGVASSYRIEEDGKAYRFTIRSNLTWQDGQVVSPKDITYAFSDTETLRTQNDILYRITAQKQSDSAQDPVLPVSFLSTVTQPLFRQVQERFLFFKPTSKIIGLGAYAVSGIQYKGNVISQITLESEKERLVYRFYATEHDAIVAFKHGSVDSLEGMQNLEDLIDWEQVTRHRDVHRDQYVGIFFNLSYTAADAQQFSTKSLRTALNFAIQKKQGDERIYSPIASMSWAYVDVDDDIDLFEQNFTQAIDLLIRTELQSPLDIQLSTIPPYSDLAESIKTSWEELGNRTYTRCIAERQLPTQQCENKKISVTIHFVNVPDLSNYQVLLIGQQIPSDPDQYSVWHSTQPTNFTHFKNTRIDKLLEDGRRAQSRDERKLIYQEFQRLLVKESPAIFLEPITTYTVERKHNFL